MLTKVLSIVSVGLQGIEVEIETNVAEKGFPGFSIVGLASKASEEAKERVKTAIINSDIEFPNAKGLSIWRRLICPKMDLVMIYRYQWGYYLL